MLLDDEVREALEAGLPHERRVLRAAQVYLLPAEVRLGLELAMYSARDLMLDEGMGELEGLPVLTLAEALRADLEAAMAVAEEGSREAAGGSLSPQEVEAAAAVGKLARALRQETEKLRAALEEASG